MEVQISESVPFYDTDCGGVVSNIAYLRYIEKARMALFVRMGMDAGKMTSTGIFPAVVRTEIDYLAPGRLGDEIQIVVRLDSVEKARAHCSFQLQVQGSDGTPRLLVKATQTVALVQTQTGRPQRMPAEWQDWV